MGTPGFPLCVSPLTLPANNSNKTNKGRNRERRCLPKSMAQKVRLLIQQDQSGWVLRRGGYEYIVNLLELSRKMNNSLPSALEFHINPFLVFLLYSYTPCFWKTVNFFQQDGGLVHIYLFACLFVSSLPFSLGLKVDYTE